MADPLSISASIAGLITLADVVFVRLTKYVRSVKKVGEEIKSLAREINLLGGALNSLLRLARSFEDEPFDTVYREYHIGACRDILSAINEKLKEFDSTDSIRKLKWPFSSIGVKEMLDDLTRHKQSIDLALSANSMELLHRSLAREQDIEKSTTEILLDVKKTREITSRIHDNSEHQLITKMFLKCNPQKNYEKSLELRHPRTGLWLMQLPVFQTWQSTPGEKLWLSGMAGAGKTVIAGSIIESALSRSNEKVAVAFFFCDYKDEATLKPVNILSALAYQIATQNAEAYEILERYHNELKPRNLLPKDPSVSGLQKIIGEMTEIYDQSLLIVDGLDECEKLTVKVLESLCSISEHSDKISIVLLSRDEINIREKLEEKFRHEAISAHTEDITEYVKAEIEERIRTRRLRIGNDTSLKGDILHGLVDGAAGMFRWVACQLDHLCGCISDKECREALTKLPPNLDETYLRILKRVPQRQARLVHMTLLFIAYAKPRLGIRQLQEALSVASTGEFLETNSLVHEHSIQRLCSSLIRKSNCGKYFEFAHFSVAEFLQNESVLKDELSSFLISKSQCNQLLAIQCLIFLQLENFNECPTEPRDLIEHLERINDEYKFYWHAAAKWPVYARDEWGDERIVELAKGLFHSQKTPMFISWSVELILRSIKWQYKYNGSLRSNFAAMESAEYDSDDEAHPYINSYIYDDYYGYRRIENMTQPLTDRSFTPLHLASILSLPEICSVLIQQGVKVELKSRVGTPVQCAVRHFRVFERSFADVWKDQCFGENRTFKYAVNTVEVLKNAGAKLSSTRPSRSGPTSLIHDAMLIFSITEDLSMATFLVSDPSVLREHDVTTFSQQLDFYCAYKNSASGRFDQSLQNFIKALNTLIDISPLHWRLCEVAWEKAISMNLKFALDLNNIDSRISYSPERLQSAIFAASNTGDLVALKKLSGDLRVNVAELADAAGKTLLHHAMNSSYLKVDVDVIEFLLDAGCKPVIPDSKGRLPFHVWKHHRFEDPDQVNYLVKILISHGMNVKVQDPDGCNVLHTNVDSPTRLRALLEHDTEANTTPALSTINNDGYTPLSLALFNYESESATLLFERGGLNITMLQSPTPVPLLAARANCEHVFRSLEEAGINAKLIEAEDITPLHYLGYRASLSFVNYLKSIYKDACRLHIDDELPLHVYINQCLNNPIAPHEDIITALVAPLMVDPMSEEAGSIWEQFCRRISTFGSEVNFIANQQRYLLNPTVKCLMGLGVLQSYEAVRKRCTLLQLLETCSSKFESGPDRWPIFSDLLCDIIRRADQWTDASVSVLVIRLLATAIKELDVGIVTALLQKGVNVHHRPEILSPLEQVCQKPRKDAFHHEESVRCIFKLVLGHADPERLNETNPRNGGLGLIHYLAFPGSSWQINELLKRGADPNLRTRCPLKLPALNYHIEANQFASSLTLLKAGADPTLVDNDGFDAAMQAAFNGVASFLLELRSIQDPPWQLNWQATGRLRVANNILYYGLNALHLASGNGHVDCLKFYMDHALLVNPDPVSAEMHTPLHFAALNGHIDVVKFLLGKGANVNARSKNEELPLHFAARGGEISVVKLLIDAGSENSPDKNGMFPIAWALQGKNKQIVEYFQRNVDVGTKSMTSLGERGFAILLQVAIKDGDITECKRLQLRGCPLNLDLIGCSSCSPLLLAIDCRKVSIILWLLANGALTQKAPCGKHGPLTAINKILKYRDLVEALPVFLDKYLSDGGSILDESPNPVATAAANGNTPGLRILLEHIQQNKGHYAALVNQGDANVIGMAVNRCPKIDDNPPLIKAIRCGDYESVQVLLESGADPNSLDPGEERASPLHIAVAHSSEKIAQEITEVLIHHGADLESRDSYGRTPLMTASDSGRWNLVDALIQAGACLSSSTWDYDNALRYARTPQAFVKFISLGLDPYRKNLFGVSPILDDMQYNRFHSLILNGDFPVDKIGPFPWSESWNHLLCSVTMLFRRLSRKISWHDLQQLGNFEPQGSWSPLCLAAFMGMLTALDNLLTIGAKIEFEGCPEGTALMSACHAGRLDSVIFLIRRGAALSYHGPNGFRSAFDESKTSKRILHWLLVTRFTDQKKLTYEACADRSERPTSMRPWSGPTQAELVIYGDLERRSDECAKDYWFRLMRAKRDWRGRYVPPQGGRKTARPSKLVPQESVRIHPEGYETPKVEVRSK
ncbi:ankyrin [Biscogniauxia marginata]|nr:ankyrin [Biscogniauxia marginata]